MSKSGRSRGGTIRSLGCGVVRGACARARVCVCVCVCVCARSVATGRQRGARPFTILHAHVPGEMVDPRARVDDAPVADAGDYGDDVKDPRFL